MNQIPPTDPDQLESQAITQPVYGRGYSDSTSTRPSLNHPHYEPPPADPLSTYQPIHIRRASQRRSFPRGCGCIGILVGFLFLIMATYFLFPARTRLLIFGIDAREDGGVVGRSDTIILMQVNPFQPDIHMLSIPRDLWVFIPDIGENRINTAHFFAEANQEGSGPQALIKTIETNFNIRPHYFARVRFSSFREIVDAMGGLDITLADATGGLDPGQHHLNGEQALAFARDRQDGDDFDRMKQGQIVLLAVARRMLNPLVWPRLPAIANAFFLAVDTNIPVWELPRLAFALARARAGGIDQRTLSREMTTPFTTTDGAQVLGPNWDLIHPMIIEMFGE